MRRDSPDEFNYLVWILGAAAVVGIVMGLIEWNARRQAAAMTRELLRPATAEDRAAMQRAMDAQLAELEQAHLPYDCLDSEDQCPLGRSARTNVASRENDSAVSRTGMYRYSSDVSGPIEHG